MRWGLLGELVAVPLVAGALAPAETRGTISLRRKLRPGRYRLAVSLTHPVNRGTAVLRESKPFLVR